MFTAAILVAILVGLAMGGTLRNLAAYPFRGFWLIIGALGLQWMLRLPALRLHQAGQAILLPGLALSYLGLVVALMSNRRIPGAVLAALGIAANATVILANGGRMPVSLELLRSAGLRQVAAAVEQGSAYGHSLLSASTHLRWLADIFLLPPPFPRPATFSIGDVLLAAGLLIAVPCAMRRGATGPGSR